MDEAKTKKSKKVDGVETTVEETPVETITEWPQLVKDVVEEKAMEKTVSTNTDVFSALGEQFYTELEKLRVATEAKHDSKPLIANAGAYMKKALQVIKAIKDL